MILLSVFAYFFFIPGHFTDICMPCSPLDCAVRTYRSALLDVMTRENNFYAPIAGEKTVRSILPGKAIPFISLFSPSPLSPLKIPVEKSAAGWHY